jgi:hypothetical protein
MSSSFLRGPQAVAATAATVRATATDRVLDFSIFDI